MKKVASFLLCVLAMFSPAWGKESPDPVALVSPIIGPAMEGFEALKVEKFLRGTSLRADSFTQIDKEFPSEYGLFLRMTVHDEGPAAKFRDDSRKVDGMVFRNVTLPQQSAEDLSLEIEVIHGDAASKDVVAAVTALIDNAIAAQQQLTIDEALDLARRAVQEQGIDVSDAFIASASLLAEDLQDRGKVWLITYLLTRDARGHSIKGGQLSVRVFMDGSTEVGLGSDRADGGNPLVRGGFDPVPPRESSCAATGPTARSRFLAGEEPAT